MLIPFKEMKNRVQQRILNDCTSTSDNINDLLPKLGHWINERYERALEAKPWPQLIKKGSLSIVASQKGYVLPRDFGKAIKFIDTTNGYAIQEISAHEYIRLHAGALDVSDNVQTGDPVRFYQVGEYTVKAELSQAEKVSIVSTSSSDSSPLIIQIIGEVSGTEVAESVVVTGTSAVQSTNTWDTDQKLQISVATNDGSTQTVDGVITVTGDTSGTVLTAISEFDYATPYRWIEVSPTPKSSGTQPTWDLWYRRRFRALVNDGDLPMVDLCTAIIQGAYADALREDGQEQQAIIADQQYVAQVEEIWANVNTGDLVEQFIPQSRDVYTVTDYGRTVYSD